MRNNELYTTNNTQQGLLSNVMDHPLGTLTRDMVEGMVADMAADMAVADTVIMTTTLNNVGGDLEILHFLSWVPLQVVYCWVTY